MTQAVQTAQLGNTNPAWRNRIINGGMVIDQRNAGASVTPTAGQYTLDRWLGNNSQSGKYTVQQNAGSVTPPVGLINYIGVTSTSAYSVVSTDYFNIQQNIEGLNVADLGWGTANAQAITLSFKVYSSLTGTFGGSLRNDSNARSYPFTYTISSASTWTSISVTIAGDTSGTWLTTNGIGIKVGFSLGAGSTYSGTAGAWAAGNYFSATGATSVVGTNGATFYITGVQLEVGTAATNFEFRDYGRELIMCQRYYQKSWNQADAVPTSTAVGGIHVVSWGDGNAAGLVWPTAMRTSPTVTFYPTSSTTSGSVNSGGTDRSATANSPSERGFNYVAIVSGSANTYVRFQWTASAEL